MEKDIPISDVGEVKISLAGGKAVVEISAGKSVLSNGVVVQAGASATVDALALLDLLFAAIEAGSPAGTQAIEEGAKVILKSAVAAIQ